MLPKSWNTNVCLTHISTVSQGPFQLPHHLWTGGQHCCFRCVPNAGPRISAAGKRGALLQNRHSGSVLARRLEKWKMKGGKKSSQKLRRFVAWKTGNSRRCLCCRCLLLGLCVCVCVLVFFACGRGLDTWKQWLDFWAFCKFRKRMKRMKKDSANQLKIECPNFTDCPHVSSNLFPKVNLEWLVTIGLILR